MRKIISLLLLLTLLVSIFVGCNKNTLPKGMSGTDAAKLLLANERLDESLLKADGNIFTKGAQVMDNLVQKTKASMAKLRPSGGVTTPSNVTSSKVTVSTPGYGGKLEKDDEYFYWSEFVEYNNTYDLFENLTQNIITSAEIAGDMIDHVKQNVRVVDKWINNENRIRYYLHVEENSELLIEHYTADGLDLLNICTRFKNEGGKDVYQLYRKSVSEMYEERMTYIPGERYELSMKHRDGNMNCFVADGTKGYWESCILNVRDDKSASVSYFVMKDDLCYKASVDAEQDLINSLNIMSADTATDIFQINPGKEARISVMLSGFDGIQNIQAPIEDAIYNEADNSASLPSWQSGVVNLKNGKTLKYGDTLVDGKVSYHGVIVGAYAGDVYAGEMLIGILGENQQEQLEVFQQFLAETGLTCRRDINLVLAGVNSAYTDALSIANYYRWNDVPLTNQQSILQARDKELERFALMLESHTQVKDAPEIDIADTRAMELNINFAPITTSSFGDATLDGAVVSVASVSLTIQDTTLYVKDEPYKVMFALADSNGGLVHVHTNNDKSTAYDGKKTFTVTAQDLQFDLPVLALGDYTLVAYVATADGIRASQYTAVTDVAISNFPLELQNLSLSATKDGNGATVVSYQYLTEFTLQLTTEKLNYKQFAEQVYQLVFEYGTPAEVIEVQLDGAFVTLAGNEAEITSGTYRVGYKVENGANTVEGYVYIQYTSK